MWGTNPVLGGFDSHAPPPYPNYEVMMTAYDTYAKFARYYDAYTREFDDDVLFYTSLCRSGEKIVEIGCGTGRVLRPILEHGFPITGIDVSPEMLALAKARLAPFARQELVKLSQYNVLHAPLPEQFDLALVTFYTFNYILEQPERFLSNLFLSLTDRAICVLDLFVPKTLRYPKLGNLEDQLEKKNMIDLISLAWEYIDARVRFFFTAIQPVYYHSDGYIYPIVPFDDFSANPW